jgi:hypothetical protein
MLSHEHGYLNAISELGGASPGAPRKPYRRIPDEAAAAVRAAAADVQALEAAL